MQLPSIQIAMEDPGLSLRPVVPGGGGGGRSVNLISTRRGRLCPPNDTGTPGFSDLPTALPLRKNDIPQAQ